MGLGYDHDGVDCVDDTRYLHVHVHNLVSFCLGRRSRNCSHYDDGQQEKPHSNPEVVIETETVVGSDPGVILQPHAQGNHYDHVIHSV